MGGQGPDTAEILRLTSAGVLDQTFGMGGVASPPTEKLDSVFGLAIARNGRVLVGGTTDINSGQSVIVRLTTSGRFDHSFRNGGTSSMVLPESTILTHSGRNFTASAMTVRATQDRCCGIR